MLFSLFFSKQSNNIIKDFYLVVASWTETAVAWLLATNFYYIHNTLIT